MGTTTYMHAMSLSCVEGQRISQFFWAMTLQKRSERTDPFLLLLIDNDYFINISISINIISGKASGAPPTSGKVIMGIMIPLILGVSYTCPSLIFIKYSCLPTMEVIAVQNDENNDL